ncbi:MAG: aldo/keto reductase [candidate division Zixibacteria bacterium]|nr:aldo/keto reductase [candidate division Zixibacteria bacterium]
MNRRQLGNSGLEVSPLAFGGNVFGWTVDDPGAFNLLDAFVGAGFNFIDTADVYSSWAPGNSGGESETIIGRWMKQRGNRDRVVIATKVGMAMAPDRKGLSRPYIMSAVEASLRRLQTDHIDLYQSHVDDSETPLEETLAAYGQLISEGKVRAIGASNYSADRLSEALRVSRDEGLPTYCCLQPLYNLYDRAEFEAQLGPLCLQEGIAVISYSSLASGFLTGKYRSEIDLAKSPRGVRTQKRLNERGFRILAALDQVAERHRSTPSRVALAWLLAQPSVTAPIVSATNLEQLGDILASIRLQLDYSSLDLLKNASA